MSYIGKTTDGFGVRDRFIYVVSGGATSVSGADANGATLKFTDGAYVDVYLNGVLLKAGTDYNTNTANTIAGIASMSANDEVTVIVYDVFTVADTVSAASGGTFSGGVTFDTDTVKIRSDNASLVFRRTTSEADIAKIQYVNGNPSLDIGADGKNVRFTNGGSYAETMRVGTNGNITIQDGDLVIGTSGHGIDFSATSGSAGGSTSALLDDYEEGTFTPAADSFDGTMTFTTARYTKIGKLVHVNFKMTSDGTSDSSQVSISGFPFSAVAEHPVSMSYDMAGSGNMQGTTTPSVPNAMINTAEIMYVYFPSGGGWQYSHMGTGFIRVSGTYITT